MKFNEDELFAGLMAPISRKLNMTSFYALLHTGKVCQLNNLPVIPQEKRALMQDMEYNPNDDNVYYCFGIDLYYHIFNGKYLIKRVSLINYFRWLYLFGPGKSVYGMEDFKFKQTSP